MARLSTASSAGRGNGHATAPTNRAAGRPLQQFTEEDFEADNPNHESKQQIDRVESLLRSELSLIALQAFFLGLTLAGSLLLTTWLALQGNTIWRLPSFFACLSLFHFLEFWTTARFNSPTARADSFLLYSNGTAYNVAHGLATLEIVISNFVPEYQARFVNVYTILTGALMVIVGQVVRSLAMAQAGTNFNHLPQKVRKEGHVLVTTGVYSFLRHPSYFGFFWWALGTQILVGNKISFVGYLLVLWHFFSRRIAVEEKLLIGFFGDDYETYRKRTPVVIPFVR